MKTDELIQELSRDLTAVRPDSPRGRWWVCILVSATFTGLLLLLIHLRSDLPDCVYRPEFLIRQALLVVVAFVAQNSLVSILWPQSHVSRPARWFLTLSAAALGLELVVRSSGGHADAGFPPAWFNAVHCAASIVAASSLLTGLLIVFARGGATTHPVQVGLLSAVVAVALCSWATNMACANENPAHLLFSHLLLPAALVGAGSGLAGRYILNW